MCIVVCVINDQLVLIIVWSFRMHMLTTILRMYIFFAKNMSAYTIIPDMNSEHRLIEFVNKILLYIDFSILNCFTYFIILKTIIIYKKSIILSINYFLVINIATIFTLIWSLNFLNFHATYLIFSFITTFSWE